MAEFAKAEMVFLQFPKALELIAFASLGTAHSRQKCHCAAGGIRCCTRKSLSPRRYSVSARSTIPLPGRLLAEIRGRPADRSRPVGSGTRGSTGIAEDSRGN
jgi:hypothetical protein